MGAGEDRLSKVERQMEAVLRRLDALDVVAPAPGEVAEEPSVPPGRVGGTLAYSGVIRVGDRSMRMQARDDLAEALEADPAVVARLFAALGSPFRVLLLRALLAGPKTSQQLQAELDVGAVGQLYHHLKELLAAGLIVQRKRSLYAIRPEKAMFICLVFAAAPRLISEHASTLETPGQPEEEAGQS